MLAPPASEIPRESFVNMARRLVVPHPSPPSRQTGRGEEAVSPAPHVEEGSHIQTGDRPDHGAAISPSPRVGEGDRGRGQGLPPLFVVGVLLLSWLLLVAHPQTVAAQGTSTPPLLNTATPAAPTEAPPTAPPTVTPTSVGPTPTASPTATAPPTPTATAPPTPVATSVPTLAAPLVRFVDDGPLTIEVKPGATPTPITVRLVCLEADLARCPRLAPTLVGVGLAWPTPATQGFAPDTRAATVTLALPSSPSQSDAGLLVIPLPGQREPLTRRVALTVAAPAKAAPTVVARPDKIDLTVTGIGPLARCSWAWCADLLHTLYHPTIASVSYNDLARPWAAKAPPSVLLELAATTATTDTVALGATRSLAWVGPAGVPTPAPLLSIALPAGAEDTHLPLRRLISVDPLDAHSDRYETRVVFDVSGQTVGVPVTLQVRDPRGYIYLTLALGIALGTFAPGYLAALRARRARWASIEAHGPAWARLADDITAFLSTPAVNGRPPADLLQHETDAGHLLAYIQARALAFKVGWEAATRGDRYIDDLPPAPALGVTDPAQWADVMPPLVEKFGQFKALFARAESFAPAALDRLAALFDEATPDNWPTKTQEINTQIDAAHQAAVAEDRGLEEGIPKAPALPPPRRARVSWLAATLVVVGVALIALSFLQLGGLLPLVSPALLAWALLGVGAVSLAVGLARSRRVRRWLRRAGPVVASAVASLLLAALLTLVFLWSVQPDSILQLVQGAALVGLPIWLVVWALGVPRALWGWLRPAPRGEYRGPLRVIGVLERLWPAAAVLVVATLAVISLESKATFGRPIDYLEALLWGAGLRLTADASALLSFFGVKKGG